MRDYILLSSRTPDGPAYRALRNPASISIGYSDTVGDGCFDQRQILLGGSIELLPVPDGTPDADHPVVQIAFLWGDVQADAGETRWRFLPATPWRAGAYELWSVKREPRYTVAVTGRSVTYPTLAAAAAS
jgi:hypothetical protein